MPDNNNQSKVTTLASVRAGMAHLMELIASTIQAAIAYVFDRAGFLYLGTTENVQTVLDFFNTHDLKVGGVWYRYIGEVETSEVEGFGHQFGRLLDEDGHVSQDEVVYGNRREYDDLSEGSTVYAGSTEQTVSDVRLPTQGYVNLTGFTEPWHVMEGTNYMC